MSIPSTFILLKYLFSGRVKAKIARAELLLRIKRTIGRILSLFVKLSAWISRVLFPRLSPWISRVLLPATLRIFILIKKLLRQLANIVRKLPNWGQRMILTWLGKPSVVAFLIAIGLSSCAFILRHEIERFSVSTYEILLPFGITGYGLWFVHGIIVFGSLLSGFIGLSLFFSTQM